MHILHITSWYPDSKSPYRTPFIAEHVQALSAHATQELCHVEVQNSHRLWMLTFSERETNQSSLILYTRLRNWRLRELLTLALLVLLRLRLLLSRKHWDLAIIHIAYPLIRFPRMVQWLFGTNLLLIEHWSAYQRRFNLPEKSQALKRMQSMFNHQIPVVAVSKALAGDIQRFANRTDFPLYIVPNAIDTRLFHPACLPENRIAHSFLMVASWAPIKRPLLVMEAVRNLLPQYPEIQLRVIGAGDQFNDMQEFVAFHQLNETIVLLGSQPKNIIAKEMRRADAFLHASNYETFSVVCAEALCSGLPVLASNVGALPELIHPSNGLLVDNSVNAWTDALSWFLHQNPDWDRIAIAQSAISRFSHEAVGSSLMDIAIKTSFNPVYDSCL